MTVYRITNTLYKDDISGIGAKTHGARWNRKGIAALYTSEHVSLCVLEMLVNITFEESQLKYHLLEIEIPDIFEPAVINLKKLKNNWEDDTEYTGFIGSEFLHNGQSLFLKVPSAVIKKEHNFIINPLHPDFKKVKIKNAFAFKFDRRLFTF
jgi:RES domain-containing protein